MILSLPQAHEGSEYVLSFEIGQREGGFCIRTNRHTDTPSTVLVYRFLYIYILVDCNTASYNSLWEQREY